MTRKLPVAISSDMLTQESGKELLLYNLKTNKAYCLNETATQIYLACDGKTSFEELKAQTNFSDDLIFLALDDLKKENLINKDYQSNLVGINRREAVKKIGLTTMAALPVINSLVAPSAANAQSSSVVPTTCEIDPAPSDCLVNESYRVGFATSFADCQNKVNALPPCCGGIGKAASYDPVIGCCESICFECGPLNC